LQAPPFLLVDIFPLLTWFFFFLAILIRALYYNELTGTIPTQLEIPGLEYLYLLDDVNPVGVGNNFCPMTNYSTWAQTTDYPFTDDCNACVRFTCQNGGNCFGGFDQLFTCSCEGGYTGANCEIVDSGSGDIVSAAEIGRHLIIRSPFWLVVYKDLSKPPSLPFGTA